MNSRARRSVVGVVNFTTRIPSLVVELSTTVMLSGMGRSNGTLRKAAAKAADVGDGVTDAVGHVGVGIGRGVAVAVGALPPLHPTRAERTTADAVTGTNFTVPRYWNCSDCPSVTPSGRDLRAVAGARGRCT